MSVIMSFLSAAGPRPKLIPMQPRPMAETSRSLFPSFRFCICSSAEGPWGGSPHPLLLTFPPLALRGLLEASDPETERNVPPKGLPNPVQDQADYPRHAVLCNLNL